MIVNDESLFLLHESQLIMTIFIILYFNHTVVHSAPNGRLSTQRPLVPIVLPLFCLIKQQINVIHFGKVAPILHTFLLEKWLILRGVSAGTAFKISIVARKVLLSGGGFSPLKVSFAEQHFFADIVCWSCNKTGPNFYYLSARKCWYAKAKYRRICKCESSHRF